jgi:hypothetical protein
MGTEYTDQQGAAYAAKVDADLATCEAWLEVAPSQLERAARAMAAELAETTEDDRSSLNRDARYLAGLRFGIEAVVKQVPGFNDPGRARAARAGLVWRYLNR